MREEEDYDMVIEDEQQATPCRSNKGNTEHKMFEASAAAWLLPDRMVIDLGKSILLYRELVGGFGEMQEAEYDFIPERRKYRSDELL